MRHHRPILVLGSTGKVGRRVTAQLSALERPVRAASRSSSIRFDWSDPTTWRPALEGAGSLFLVHPETPGPVEPFLDLVRSSDVDRIVMLSARHPEQSGDGLVPMVEQAVGSLDVPSVLLRPAWFVQNFTEGMFTEEMLSTGRLRLPVGDGREPFIDAADIAAVAVRALLDDTPASAVRELSGPESMSFDAAVRTVGESWGRDLRLEPVSEAQFADDLAGTVRDDEIEVFLNLFRAIATGTNDHVDTGVEDALGRSPRRLADSLTETVAPL